MLLYILRAYNNIERMLRIYTCIHTSYGIHVLSVPCVVDVPTKMKRKEMSG